MTSKAAAPTPVPVYLPPASPRSQSAHATISSMDCCCASLRIQMCSHTIHPRYRRGDVIRPLNLRLCSGLDLPSRSWSEWSLRGVPSFSEPLLETEAAVTEQNPYLLSAKQDLGWRRKTNKLSISLKASRRYAFTFTFHASKAQSATESCIKWEPCSRTPLVVI